MGTTAARCIWAAAILIVASPFAGEAGSIDLEGTNWTLSGKVRVSGVARRHGRAFAFRDGRHLDMTASFPFATEFAAHDLAGWDYSGDYEVRGRRGNSVRFTLDAASETEFDTMLETWLSAVADESVSAQARTTQIKASLHGQRMTVVGTRRFSATTPTRKAGGTWTMRASGSVD